MKKYLSLFVVFILIFICFTYSASAAFSDVSEEYSWAAESIEYLSQNKIISGYPDGSFKPANNVTAAEAAKIITLLFGKASKSRSYEDVDEESWYYEYISDAGDYFIRENKFEPDKSAARKEIVYAIYRALPLEAVESKSELGISSEDEYYNAVAAAYESGIIKGYEDKSLGLDKPVTRAEFAVTVVRALDIKAASELDKSENSESTLPSENTENQQNSSEKAEKKTYKENNFFFVVADVITAVDENNNPMKKICGYNDGEYEEIMFDEAEVEIISGTSTENVRKNDVIYIYRDYFGTVKNIFIAANAEAPETTSEDSEIKFSDKLKYICGYVDRIINGKTIELETGASYRTNDSTHFYVYEKGEISVGKISKIREKREDKNGSGIFAFVKNEIITDILIMRN